MITLGIETSCDETSVCFLETKGEYPSLEYRVLSHIIHSQIDIHSRYGGVFPMMAKREHAKRLVPLLEQAIKRSGVGTETAEPTKESLENMKKICGKHDEELYRSLANSSLIKGKPVIDRIAVTHGPGLEPALWVGINFANALASLWKIPVIGVNHMEGHIVASLLSKTETQYAFEPLLNYPLPAIAFLISGGHTEIVFVNGVGDYKVLGRTRDDAIGEAFDKVARMLGLPYPGGPEISRLAEMQRKEITAPDIATFSSSAKLASRDRTSPSRPFVKVSRSSIHTISARSNSPRAVESSASSAIHSSLRTVLPRPMIDANTLDMSFAGLKTAVLYELRKHEEIDEPLKKEVAREFEDAVTDVIISKLGRAFDAHEARTLIVGGGVLANKHILEACKAFSVQHGVVFLPPASGLSGDNALMIATAGALDDTDGASEIHAQGNLSL